MSRRSDVNECFIPLVPQEKDSSFQALETFAVKKEDPNVIGGEKDKDTNKNHYLVTLHNGEEYKFIAATAVDCIDQLPLDKKLIIQGIKKLYNAQKQSF